MAREAAGDPELASLHTDWLAVFEAEVQWWTEFFKSPENRAAFGIADKEPFRPALDRARWALPGTIATGSSHTSSLRERARVLDVGGCLTAPDSNANQLWQDVRETYRQALPGLADMGLREAVYKTGTVLPHNVSTLLTRVDPLPKMCTMTVSQSALVPPGVPIRQSKKTYLDPVYNQAQQVDFRIQCSIAVARDWHRHRTAYPWYMHIISDEIQIDPHYEAKSDFAKERVAGLLRRSNDCFNRHMADQRVTQAAMALPLGTYVQIAASAGMRDFTYMTELRAFAAGANFEYKDQAEEFLRMM